MTPDASASIGALLQLLGMPAPPLPDADPQALNASAARWISSANAQDGIGRGADGHVARVLTHNAGQAPDALAAAYTAEEGNVRRSPTERGRPGSWAGPRWQASAW
ncbi:hypothetical protein ACFQYP_32180 [Nonomuraea antimicrobica]